MRYKEFKMQHCGVVYFKSPYFLEYAKVNIKDEYIGPGWWLYLTSLQIVIAEYLEKYGDTYIEL